MAKIYLYKKTHNKTGLQYFGKTKSSDPHKYQGSGVEWREHIAEHGYDVTTEIIKECQTIEEATEWGLYYSELWNIVEARDENGNKIWANLMPENAKGGTTSEVQNRPSRLKQNQEATTKNWQDPDIRERRISGLIRAQNDPTVVKNKSNSMKKTLAKKLQNPEFLKQCQDNAARARLKRMDRNIYKFEHCSGITEQCMRSELVNKYSLRRSGMSDLFKGTLKTTGGWKLVGRVN